MALRGGELHAARVPAINSLRQCLSFGSVTWDFRTILSLLDTGAAVILGILQGLTEFLPVSSSGHLVLGREFLPDDALGSPGVLFEVVVHLGTLVAAVVFLRREIVAIFRSLLPGAHPDARPGRRLAVMLVVGSVPAAVVGLGLRDLLLTAFDGTGAAAGGLVVTGAALLGSRRLETAEEDARPDEAAAAAGLPETPDRVADALIVGAAQAVAILPGISRSGFTILAGRLRGLSPSAAARFSFLLSAPVIAGAALAEGGSALAAGGLGGDVLGELALGFAAAMVSGLFALRWVFAWLEERRFHRFGWYCLLVGGLGLGWTVAS